MLNRVKRVPNGAKQEQMEPDGVKQAKRGQTRPNGAKQGQTGPTGVDRAKQDQIEPNGVKHGQPRPNGVRPGQMGPSRDKWGNHPWVGG